MEQKPLLKKKSKPERTICMKYQLSCLVPGIRTKNWLRLYHSISTAFMFSWEIIFVGPYDLPEELKGFDNVKYIKDFGSPIRVSGSCF